MKILIAEDDPVMLALIGKQLENDNYTVIATKDGNEALTALETFTPDLVITDLLMPFTSGLELIGIIRSNHGTNIPIIVLSALDEEATVMEAFTIGADDFLTKPFKGSELSIRIKRLLKNNKKKNSHSEVS